MQDDKSDLPAFAQNPPWRVRPILLVLVDLRDWLFRYGAINLLWFVLSLTVILMPPATAALHEVVRQTYHNKEPSLRMFINGMKRHFAISYVWALVMLLVMFIGGGAILFYVTYQISIGIVFAVAVSLLLLLSLFYYLPYLILDHHPLRALKNSVFTALADPALVVMYFTLIVVFGIPGIVTIAPIMFILPVIFSQIGMYSLIDWLYHYERIEGQKREI